LVYKEFFLQKTSKRLGVNFSDAGDAHPGRAVAAASRY
jgi:hypothetical protein